MGIIMEFKQTDFVVYKVLTDSEKVSYFFETIQNGVETTTKKYFTNKFKSIVNDTTKKNIGIISYKYEMTYPVMIIYDNECIHVNSNSLKAITTMVQTMLMSGDIVMRDIVLPKSIDKNLYHLKYYRKYRRINPPAAAYKISLN